VLAAAAGTVKALNSSFGRIEVDHGNGYETWYMHLSRFDVIVGQSVEAGQVIGVSGDVGSAGNPHLHFEVRLNGVPVDPYGWAGAGSDPYLAAPNQLLWAVAPPPDLTVAATVAGSYSAGQAASIPVTVTRSGGSLTLGTYVDARLYFSSDATWDGADTQLWASGSSAFLNSTLNSSGSVTVTASVTLPSVPAGTYYILAVVDPSNFHPESNEGNNVAAYAVAIGQQSDLVPLNLTRSPSFGLVGTMVTVSFTVYNQGAGTAGASTANIRLSPSSTAPSPADSLLATVSVPSVAAGASYAVSQNVRIPSVSAGAYYIWVILDVGSSANQSNEANDRASTPFTVLLPAPTLVGPGDGTTVSSTTPTFSWSSVSGANKYWLTVASSRSTLPTDPNATSCPGCVISVSLSATSYTPASGVLAAGSTYWWQVQAFNDLTSPITQGAYSTQWSFSTPGVPPTPTNPSPGSTSSPGPVLASTTVTFSWTASSGATYYDLGVRDVASGTLVVNVQPTGTSYTATLSPGKQYRWNVAACNTAGCSSFTTVLYFQTPTTQVQLITNGGFESGSTGWSLSGNAYVTTAFSYHHTGAGYAYLGGDLSGNAVNNANGVMYQVVSIPSTATSATLTFWYNITSQETSTSTAFDVLNVTIQNSSGGYLATVAVLSNLHKAAAGVYSQVSFDVTAYRGQTIRVHFLATSDASLPTIFRIDDVSLIAQ